MVNCSKQYIKYDLYVLISSYVKKYKPGTGQGRKEKG